MHAALPLAPLYSCKAHAVHVPPSAPVCPLLHTHWERAVCPVASVTEFTGQAVQASKDTPPTVVEYFPAEQLVQTDTPVVEAYLPASQLMQVLLAVAAVV